MKKILCLFLLLILFVSGCGSSGVDTEIAKELTEPVTIELWHPFSQDVEKSLQEITDEFNAQNEMVEVKLVGQGVYNDLYTKLQAAKSSDTLPTMSFTYASWDELRGSFEDLNNYKDISEYEMDFTNFVPAFLEEVTGANGEIYGLPYNKSTDVLFYNKDLVKEAGISKDPENLEELFTDAKKITDVTGVVGFGYDSLQNYLATSMISNSVSWMDEEGKFQFDNKEVEADVKLYQDAIEEGYGRTRGEDGYFSDILGAQGVAAYVGSSAGATYIDSAVNGKFEWGVLPVPFEKAPQQGTNIVIYNTATPEEKLAAWEYLNFLFQDENLVKFALDTGYMPATTSAIASPEYEKASKDDELIQATTASVDKMEVTVESFKGAGEIFSNNIAVSMSKIFDNLEDIDTTLKALNEEAKAIYDRNN